MGKRCFFPHPTLGHLGFSASLEERFFEKVCVVPYDLGCWLWCGSRHGFGYGHIGRGKDGSGVEKAHIVSWLIHHGPIPDGLWVLHQCDNPCCVNHNHLYLGTPSDNCRDAAVRGRNSRKLNEQSVSEIRSSWPDQSQKQLSERYGVVPETIWHVVHRSTWKHVE